MAVKIDTEENVSTKSLLFILLFCSTATGIFFLSSCSTPRSTKRSAHAPVVPAPETISEKEVTRLIPDYVKDRPGWAEDIVAAIKLVHRPVTAERACATIAVIEQESGFQVDPVVKNFPTIVRQGLEKKFSRLRPFAGTVVNRVLQTRVPGETRTFEQRIAKLRTESDLDRLFRDIEASVRRKFPAPAALASVVTKLMGQGWLEDFNPVTTAGPMQVKVAYAKTLDGLKHLPDGEVRDLLYTRKVGVRAGTARLLDYEAGYDGMKYRFADYNAGTYSSRNAAFQSQLSDLSKSPLIPDGDLLSYAPDGAPLDQPTRTLQAMLEFGQLHQISEAAVRHAARSEKTVALEDEPLWKEVRSAWQKKTGKSPAYAVIPQVTLNSPKMRSPRSTEWFAKSVQRRYEACRSRR